MELATSHDTQAETTVLTVEGEIDMAVAGDFLQACITALATTDEVVQLDLAGVTFMDSMALGMLVRAQNAARSADKRLVLLKPSEQLQRLLEITGLDQVLEVIASPTA